ncbi:hypothetical protein M0R45_006719 [Rubus argutus]|uniref:Uncharacterized protein n=1 Tax=Rubus argutus TaxID=59490 RepID=A0AAW1YRK1_RUBAR
MESNSITPTPSPATNFTHSSTGTTPSQTPTSTPIPVRQFSSSNYSKCCQCSLLSILQVFLLSNLSKGKTRA